MRFEEYLELEPYSLKKEQKEKFLLKELNNLTEFHKKNSSEYGKILSSFSYKKAEKLEDFFILPVRLFKHYALKSIADEEVVKVLTSSGTTSQLRSKIFLDKQTAFLQTKVLIKIMQSYLGKQRVPMLILDTKSVVKDRKNFSARGAGILGLANFGRKHTYLLDDDMEIDFEVLEAFMKEHKNQKIFIFGFTFMIWQFFYKKLKEKDIKLDIKNSILIHSGGWKKLTQEAVSNQRFKSLLHSQTGIDQIYDFYGMVEQVGSIFVECEYGHLHTPIFSDIIVRDPISFEPLDFGKEGLIEVLSVLPRSYPGHVLLTEDIGVVLGEDSCKCGRYGKYFKVNGRLKKAELRGCSDTHAFDLKEGGL